MRKKYEVTMQDRWDACESVLILEALNEYHARRIASLRMTVDGVILNVKEV